MALGMNGGIADGNAETAAPQGNEEAHIPNIERVDAAFPDLEICHLVGQGGMGVVYQARHIKLDRLVALKILSPRLSHNPSFAERFLREAQAMAKLSHPNILTVFDIGSTGDFYYLTMEYVDGVNLRDTISTNTLSASEALAIVPQICNALQYAHDNGVVHRDIKPENILINKEGAIKIADFGLAKLLDPAPNQVSLTATQQVMGTRNYMAPEQLETPDVVDHRADLYSLGVVFYELLTGELPLGRFSLPSEKSVNVSSRLDDVVMRTLEKDPDRRFQNASQIKTACENLDDPKASPAKNTEPASAEVAEALPLCPPLPVRIEDIYASLASGLGLLRGFESHLELEFEIRDTLLSHRWASSQVEIPIERIASIELVHKWTCSYIEVQADKFETVKDIPCSQQGKFRVHLKKKDRELAEELVWHVNRLIGSEKQTAYAPTPPVKKGSFQSSVAKRDSSGMIGALMLLLFLGFTVLLAVGLVVGAMYWKFGLKADHPSAPIAVPTIQVEPSNETIRSEA
jgi:serine/threonine protein kinase